MWSFRTLLDAGGVTLLGGGVPSGEGLPSRTVIGLPRVDLDWDWGEEGPEPSGTLGSGVGEAAATEESTELTASLHAVCRPRRAGSREGAGGPPPPPHHARAGVALVACWARSQWGGGREGGGSGGSERCRVPGAGGGRTSSRLRPGSASGEEDLGGTGGRGRVWYGMPWKGGGPPK